MKKLILEKCMNLITTYNKDLSEKDKDKIKYGLEGLYLTITKLIFIIIISIILGIFKEVILLLLTFNGIRLTAFGVHAKRSIDCLISSSLFFILTPYICINLTIPILIKEIMFIPLVVMIGILAPPIFYKQDNYTIFYQFLIKYKEKRKIFLLIIFLFFIFVLFSIFMF